MRESRPGSTSLKLVCALFLFLSVPAWAQPSSKAVAESTHADHDVSLNDDANSAFWRDSHPVHLQLDTQGRQQAEFRTEVRSRWTGKNIYFLFICPYKQLYLKPGPDPAHETYELWNWNVAEVFLGSNFKDIRRYKEFEISPQNEWIDLDVNLNEPHHEKGWVWNSGFEHTARIDEAHHVWYGAIRIPFSALDMSAPAVGKTFRMNLYRTEGPPNAAKEILWQPTMSNTFHVPERFGLLRLVAK